jgi:hypothetical protein
MTINPNKIAKLIRILTISGIVSIPILAGDLYKILVYDTRMPTPWLILPQFFIMIICMILIIILTIIIKVEKINEPHKTVLEILRFIFSQEFEKKLLEAEK